jgi:hypothetical protein
LQKLARIQPSHRRRRLAERWKAVIEASLVTAKRGRWKCEKAVSADAPAARPRKLGTSLNPPRETQISLNNDLEWRRKKSGANLSPRFPCFSRPSREFGRFAPCSQPETPGFPRLPGAIPATSEQAIFNIDQGNSQADQGISTGRSGKPRKSAKSGLTSRVNKCGDRSRSMRKPRLRNRVRRS